MTAIHETAYPRLKPNPDEYELKQNFFPTTQEIELLNASFELKNHSSCNCNSDVMEGLLSDNW